MQIDKDKQEVLDHLGSALVIANPGTGKTYLLALKYVDLLKKGIFPNEICCMTFTQKAKQEMEKRIIKFIEEQQIKNFDYGNLNVYTFHSFAMEHIEKANIISSNLLRYTIFDYLKEKEVFNYPDDYLIQEYVPKFENLIRYLKSYGITPEKINKEQTKEYLDCYHRSTDTIEKEDLEKLLEYFIEIYKKYEKIKQTIGMDYVDLLLKFTEQKNKPKFSYVLVDELQDVNKIEAQIAIETGEIIFAVGDPKQAIFGFQGGSISNFKEFEKIGAKKFNLNLNRRSTQQILDYASKQYYDKSKDENKKDVLKLISKENKQGEKPKIIETKNADLIGKIIEILNEQEKETAIITRTNYQIIEIAKELENKKMDYTTTYLASSKEAKENIIKFIKAVFTNKINEIKSAFFTPYFPITMKDAFELSENKKLTLEEIYEKSPKFKEIREQQKDVGTIRELFTEKIYPISIARGEDYLLSAEALLESAQEALNIFEGIDLETFMQYLKTTDILSTTTEKKAKIILTTVHKAKGLDFENVIYITKELKNKRGFLDYIVEGILKTQNINVEEELEEEKIRIDFVANTRAKKQLFIVTDKANELLNEKSELIEIQNQEISKKYYEKQQRAYTLFVNRDYEKAKELLEHHSEWIIKKIKQHFDDIERLSFSTIGMKASEYLEKQILKIRQDSKALKIGGETHKAIEQYLLGKQIEIPSEIKLYYENAKETIKQIKLKYPELVGVEEKIKISLSELMETKQQINYVGMIDAIFKNKNEYLLVDWKTSKNKMHVSEYRRQLEIYKKIYSKKHKIPEDQIKILIAFIGLKKVVNDGIIYNETDEKQPQKKHLKPLKAT